LYFPTFREHQYLEFPNHHYFTGFDSTCFLIISFLVLIAPFLKEAVKKSKWQISLSQLICLKLAIAIAIEFLILYLAIEASYPYTTGKLCATLGIYFPLIFCTIFLYRMHRTTIKSFINKHSLIRLK